jgi:hypothetical protein
MTEPVTASADPSPDHIRLSGIKPRFACTAYGKRSADVRDFNWDKKRVRATGYR